MGPSRQFLPAGHDVMIYHHDYDTDAYFSSFPLPIVTVRRTARLGLSDSTVAKVVLLDSDQLGPQLVSNFRRMQIPRSLIRFVRPYDDGMGLRPSQTRW
jgi:hypothetical protein